VRATERLTCCICGIDTGEAVDYVEMALTTDYTEGFQVLGAHAACLNGVTCDGFVVDVHLFGRGDDADG
jgi:hypothetical protein